MLLGRSVSRSFSTHHYRRHSLSLSSPFFCPFCSCSTGRHYLYDRVPGPNFGQVFLAGPFHAEQVVLDERPIGDSNRSQLLRSLGSEADAFFPKKLEHEESTVLRLVNTESSSRALGDHHSTHPPIYPLGLLPPLTLSMYKSGRRLSRSSSSCKRGRAPRTAAGRDSSRLARKSSFSRERREAMRVSGREDSELPSRLRTCKVVYIEKAKSSPIVLSSIFSFYI